MDRHGTRPLNSDHSKTLGSHPPIHKYYLARKQSSCRCNEIKDVEMGGYFELSAWASNSTTTILIKEAEGDLPRKEEEEAACPPMQRRERCRLQQVDVTGRRSQQGRPGPGSPPSETKWGLPASGTARQYISIVQAAEFDILCYSSCKKLIPSHRALDCEWGV